MFSAEEYQNRYPSNRQFQDAYENACDCLMNGERFTYPLWMGLSKHNAIKVWTQACLDLRMI